MREHKVVKGVMNIAIVDDHPGMIACIRTMLANWPHGHVLHTALDGIAYEKACAKSVPIHIAIIDLSMPRRDGFATIAWIKEFQPDTMAIAITFDPTDEVVRRAIAAGACAVLGKDIDEAELIKAMDHVRTTGVYVNDLFRRQLDHTGRLFPDPEATPKRIRDLLTARETEFITIACGLHNPTFEEVGKEMGIKKHTAEGHRKTIYKKLEVTKGRQDFYRIVKMWNLDKPPSA